MLARFKKGEVTLLVCSDVAARGLDIEDMSHVFNFDVPIHSEDYVHRIGRTGRAGREGHAFTIAVPEDAEHVDAIEKLIGKPIPRLAIEGFSAASLAAGEERGYGGGRGRGGRGRGRGHGRDRGRDHGRGHERRPEMSRAGQSPRAHQDAPKPEQRPEHRPERRPEHRAGETPAKSNARGDSPARPVKSFGDHMPAFLRRK
jgi:superfamily II DNA/RNA helicase